MLYAWSCSPSSLIIIIIIIFIKVIIKLESIAIICLRLVKLFPNFQKFNQSPQANLVQNIMSFSWISSSHIFLSSLAMKPELQRQFGISFIQFSFQTLWLMMVITMWRRGYFDNGFFNRFHKIVKATNSACFYLSQKFNQLFIGRRIDQILSATWSLDFVLCIEFL